VALTRHVKNVRTPKPLSAAASPLGWAVRALYLWRGKRTLFFQTKSAEKARNLKREKNFFYIDKKENHH
jgi:hypothetical protein